MNQGHSSYLESNSLKWFSAYRRLDADQRKGTNKIVTNSLSNNSGSVLEIWPGKFLFENIRGDNKLQNQCKSYDDNRIISLISQADGSEEKSVRDAWRQLSKCSLKGNKP